VDEPLPGLTGPPTSAPTHVVIAGGGTGGHTSPGLAVATLLRQRSYSCVWIGSRTGVEAKRVPESGIPYIAISTGKLRRSWAWQNVADLLVNAPMGVLDAVRALRALHPRVVFGTGGFVALPVVLGAALLRLPIVLHEQTAVPGLANRIGARFASRIAVTFPGSADSFASSGVTVTGNPLRPELRDGSRASAIARFQLDPALPLVYVTGGALGAHRINQVVADALIPLLEHAQVIHQCGDNPATGDRRALEGLRATLPPALARRYTLVPYVGAELAEIYAIAALVVARAGAGTVNECCQLGKPALYVPLPGARGDEQTANARLAERAGGAVMIPQAMLTPNLLVRRVHMLLADPAKLKQMGEQARTLAIPDAAERLVALLTESWREA